MNLGRSGLALLSVSRPAFSFSSSTVGVPKQLSARRGFVIVTAAVSYQAWANNRQSNSQLMMSSQKAAINTGYLNAADAAALDAELMSSPGFSLEQLMELAGLSVAEAVYQVIGSESTTPKILLICGPGNNGGDGLVAARHLVHFGYDCTVVYPKKSSKQHFINLVKQCEDVGVEMLDEMPKMEELRSYAGIVDSIFGFSFHGSPREPFATALKVMMEAQKEFKIPVISVDVPSGWNVDEGKSKCFQYP
jgi:NAD(P)H-hydrate epimerase